ncbi:AAA family ATPase [uncultured Bilophila sp.]|uniref:AAA family ATPase n=1 Tax=uncultured Bilophila sp. TaxID=529385 RepID=UPI00280A4F3B|nr:AAA family ATPase [uncultured Bilophila sp.]
MDKQLFEEYENVTRWQSLRFTKEDLFAWKCCCYRLDKEIKEINRYDFPCSLRNVVTKDAYISLINYYLSISNNDNKICIVTALKMYAGDKVNIGYYRPIPPVDSLLEYACKKMNCSREVAALVMGRMMQIIPENCFNMISPQRELIREGASSETEILEKDIPKCLFVNGKEFILQDPRDDDLDYSGNIEQSKCRYFDSEGNNFYFMAVRTILEGSNKPFLSIGYKSVVIRLLSRKEINDNPYATVLLCQDENISYFLRKRLRKDGHGESSNFVVSGYWEHADAQKYIDFSPLAGRNVVIIPPITEEGLRAVPEWIKLCQRGGASDVRVYTGMLLLDETPMTSEEPPAWLRYVTCHAIPLRNADTTIFKNITDKSISSKEYDDWLQDCGLKTQRIIRAVGETKNQSLISFESLSDIEDIEKVTDYSLDAMISPSNATLIWGPSNVGKTLTVLEFIKALTTRETCFGLKVSSVRKVYYLEGEPDQNRLRRACKQICHSDEQFDIFIKHFIYGTLQSHITLDEIDDGEIDSIIRSIKEKNCHIVVLDNILSLAPKAANGNATKFQKFIQSLKNNNLSVIIIHHSTKGGKSPKGPVELEALMQNIFQLEKGQDLPELQSIVAVQKALEEAGPTLKMTLTKCKVFPGLEKKFGVYHLPEGGRWELVAGESFSEIKTIDGSSSTAEMKAETLEFNAAEGNSLELTPDEERVHNSLKKLGKWVKRLELEKHCGFKADKLRLLLQSLIEKKFVTKTGRGKSTHYQAS